MKKFLMMLILVCLFSCSEEISDFQNEDKSTINSTENKIFLNPLPSREYNEERFKIELISYLIGRTLINDSISRTQFTSLSMSNDGAITINSLFNNNNFSKFQGAFQLEYYRFWFSASHWKPGDEGFGIEPLEYTPDREGPGRDINTFSEYEEMLGDEYKIFLGYLSETNCLELYFPIPLNFNIDDLRVTTVVARFNATIIGLHGGELYRSEYENEGSVVLLNEKYIGEMLVNNNNLLVIKPIIVDDYDCNYPFD